MAFQGSRSAQNKSVNPVRVEKKSRKPKENSNNPIKLHGDFSTVPNWRLVQTKNTNSQVCLSYWQPNQAGGHSPNPDTIVLKYIYIDVRTNRTFVYTKDGTKYYLARDNAYFNKNYKTGDAFELCKLLTHLTA